MNKKIVPVLVAFGLMLGVALGGGPGSVVGLIDQRLRQLGILSADGSYSVPSPSGDLSVTSVTASSYVVAKQAMVAVSRSNAQSTANATEEYVSWDTETRDDLGISAVGAGSNVKVCTFTEAGVWDANAVSYWDANATGVRQFSLQLLSSADALKAEAMVITPGHATYAVRQNVGATFRVASGDWVRIVSYQDRGGALNLGINAVCLNCTLTRRGT